MASLSDKPYDPYPNILKALEKRFESIEKILNKISTNNESTNALLQTILEAVARTQEQNKTNATTLRLLFKYLRERDNIPESMLEIIRNQYMTGYKNEKQSASARHNP